jgi:hypothetical protein
MTSVTSEERRSFTRFTRRALRPGATWLLVSIVLLALLVLRLACTPRNGWVGPIRVLFVGDSYTYFNNLPLIVQSVAESSDGGRRVLAERITGSAYTLHRHWVEGKALGRIREGRWDVVVLQEENGIPAAYPERFQSDVGLFAAEIRKTGARPMLLMIWPPLGKPEIQPPNERVVYGVGRTLRIPVIPVGAAWRKWLEDPNAPRLHAPDDRHPNFRGSYLSALTIVGMLRGKALSDAPTDLSGVLADNAEPFAPRIAPDELPLLLRCASEAQATLPDDSVTVSPGDVPPGVAVRVSGQDIGPGTPLTPHSILLDGHSG